MKTLALTTLFTLFALCSVSAQKAKKPAAKPAPPQEEFMRVAPTYVINTETGKRCLQIREGYDSVKESDEWTMYCGKLNNFKFVLGTEYTLKVVKFDPNAEEMDVIKIVGQNSGKAAPQGNRKE